MHCQSYRIFIVKKYSLKSTLSFLKDRRLPVLTRILREAMVVSTCHTLWDRYGERVAGTYIYGVSGSRPSLPPLHTVTTHQGGRITADVTAVSTPHVDLPHLLH